MWINYCRKALDAAPDNAANLRRVGYGIMNLPPQLADYDLAISCLLKSLDLCETVNILHIIGTFYHRYGKVSKMQYIKVGNIRYVHVHLLYMTVVCESAQLSSTIHHWGEETHVNTTLYSWSLNLYEKKYSWITQQK